MHGNAPSTLHGRTIRKVEVMSVARDTLLILSATGVSSPGPDVLFFALAHASFVPASSTGCSTDGSSVATETRFYNCY